MDKRITDRPTAFGVTIDPHSASDRDDAFWVEKWGEDSYFIQISIADPTALIEKDSEIDTRAREKAYTHYTRKYRTYMLPKNIATDEASLCAGGVKPALTFNVFLSGGELHDILIYRSAFTNKAEISYDEVASILQSEDHQYKALLESSFECACRLREMRKARGSLVGLNDANTTIVSEDGQVRIIPANESYVGHVIVQEFMILANEITAAYLRKCNAVCLYRNQVRRRVNLGSQRMGSGLQAVLDTIDLANPQVIVDHWISEFEPARYDVDIFGHASLAAESYTHVTAPLRRYADMVIHRILISHLEHVENPYSSDELSVLADELIMKERAFFGKNKESQRKRTTTIANDLLARALCDAAHGKELDELVHLAAQRGKGGKGLLRALEVRKQSEDINANHLYSLLIEGRVHASSEWLALRAFGYQCLLETHGWVGSLLTFAIEKLGWTKPALIIDRNDADGGSVWTAIAEIAVDGTEYVSLSYAFSTEKMAKRAAHLDLVAQIAGIPITQDAIIEALSYMPPARKKSNTALLEEICRNTEGWEQPEYLDKTIGKGVHAAYSSWLRVITPDEILLAGPEYAPHREDAHDRAAQAFIEKHCSEVHIQPTA